VGVACASVPELELKTSTTQLLV